MPSASPSMQLSTAKMRSLVGVSPARSHCASGDRRPPSRRRIAPSGQRGSTRCLPIIFPLIAIARSLCYAWPKGCRESWPPVGGEFGEMHRVLQRCRKRLSRIKEHGNANTMAVWDGFVVVVDAVELPSDDAAPEERGDLNTLFCAGAWIVVWRAVGRPLALHAQSPLRQAGLPGAAPHHAAQPPRRRERGVRWRDRRPRPHFDEFYRSLSPVSSGRHCTRHGVYWLSRRCPRSSNSWGSTPTTTTPRASRHGCGRASCAIASCARSCARRRRSSASSSRGSHRPTPPAPRISHREPGGARRWWRKKWS